MNKLKIIIVDDEELGRKNLENLLSIYCSEVEILGKASNSSKAKELIKKLEPDAVFLDIQMPGENGFEFLQSYSERGFYVIFVTASDKFGIQAIKAGAVDYLLKPICTTELKDAVNKVLELKKEKNIVKNKSKKISFSIAEGLQVLDENQIIRIQADINYSTLFLYDKRKIITSKNIGEFEKMLSDTFFIRIHKSHIINLNFVKECSRNDNRFICLTNDEKVEISRRKKSEFNKKLKALTSNKK